MDNQEMFEDQDTLDLSVLTAEIVSAYVSNNSVRPEDLASLIGDVYSALQQVPSGKAEAKAEPQEPAVSIRKSVTPDYIISLENGQKFRSLKRHLRTAYGMTPDEYRTKWGLPRDYPMVAPNYAKTRSDMARKIGLGRKAANAAAAEAAEQPAPAPAKRGRRPKAAA
jgi:predicted transcriptional regulator